MRMPPRPTSRTFPRTTNVHTHTARHRPPQVPSSAYATPAAASVPTAAVAAAVITVSTVPASATVPAAIASAAVTVPANATVPTDRDAKVPADATVSAVATMPANAAAVLTTASPYGVCASVRGCVRGCCATHTHNWVPVHGMSLFVE